MIDHKEVETYILSMPNAWLDYPFGKEVAVYKVGAKDGDRSQGKMFALVTEDKMPLQISLKCDPQLAVTLREKYATVMPGYHLNKKHWNTIICSRQVPDEEIKDFVVHSYYLVTPLQLETEEK